MGKRNLTKMWKIKFLLKRRALFAVRNVLPVLLEGEDAFTWDRYQSELKEQSGLPKDQRNSELIKRLMDKTFPYLGDM